MFLILFHLCKRAELFSPELAESFIGREETTMAGSRHCLIGLHLVFQGVGLDKFIKLYLLARILDPGLEFGFFIGHKIPLFRFL